MKQYLANYHTHTKRCGHAQGSDEQYVKAAIDAKLEVLGFSDHMPVPDNILTYSRMRPEEVAEYLTAINDLKEKYADKIKILSGFECEWLPGEPEFIYDLRKQSDFIIFGNHERLIPNALYDYTYYCSDDQDIEAYCQETKAALSTGWYSCFAHPEYFMLGRRSFSEKCRWAANYLAEVCCEYDVPMEINLKGWEKPHLIDGIQQPAYPFKEFWQEVAKYPTKAIFGTDAHRPSEVFRFDQIEAVLAYLDCPSLNIIEELELKQL